MCYQFIRISNFSNEIPKFSENQKYHLRENIHVKYEISLLNSINFASFKLGLCALLALSFLLEGICSFEKSFHSFPRCKCALSETLF